MEYTATCPAWWPQSLWELHFHRRPWPGPDHSNDSPVVDDIMASMHIHAMSYLMMDEGTAAQIRTVVEDRLMLAADNLRTYQRQSAGKSVWSLPAASSAPSVPATKGIDEATIDQMRALAAAHPFYGGAPKASSVGLREGIDQATITQMRALAAAHPSLPTAPKAQRIGSPKGIDEATLNEMRALAGAHPLYPAGPAAQSMDSWKGIDQATLDEMRARASVHPSPPVAPSAPGVGKRIDEATINQMHVLASAHFSPQHRRHAAQ